MNARLRRLQADYREVQAVFRDNPCIRVVGVTGNPPEKYVVELVVKGLMPVEEGEPVPARHFKTEIFLPLGYPRRPPFCRMLTPVFHPNIDPQKICIGDHWSAGQSLTQLIVQIAQMICYQSYNVKSPLNAEAAAWAEQNAALLPLQKGDLSTGL